MNTEPPPAHGSRESGLPAALTRVLDQVKRRQLLLTLAEFPIVLVAAIAIAWSCQALADYVFELSWVVRCVLLVIDGIGGLWLVARFVVRPWRRRLDREGAALFIERAMPEFRTALISAVELASPSADVLPQSRPLIAQLIANVTARAAESTVVARVIRQARFKRLLGRMAAPIIAALVLLIACQPTSGLLIKRILLSREQFPAATTVVAVTGDLQVEEGGEAVLTARASGEIPADGRLIVTHAGDPLEIIQVLPVAAGAAEFTQVVKNIRAGFSYHFELNDGIGPPHDVSVRFPPTATSLRFVEIPPAYTKRPETVLSATTLKLLEGSTLRVEGVASKELRGGQVRIQGAEIPVALEIDFFDSKRFLAEIPVPGSGWKSLTVHLEGTAGDGSVSDPIYPIELRRDGPPTVTLTAPKDETITVIANEAVPIAFEANDDFELTSTVLHYRIFRLMPDGSTDDAGTGKIPLKVPPGERVWRHRFAWNLGLLVPAVTTGYSIGFWLEATDNNGVAPATGRSAEYTIRVISEQEKRLELLDLLGRKAAEIERLYEQQRAINQQTETATQ
jgi:hypothetical protein